MVAGGINSHRSVFYWRSDEKSRKALGQATVSNVYHAMLALILLAVVLWSRNDGMRKRGGADAEATWCAAN